jgi:hypothetical protein
VQNADRFQFTHCGKRGALAQLGERLVCNQEVTGSIPVRSIKCSNELARSSGDAMIGG